MHAQRMPRRHVRVLGEAVVERLLERRRVEAVGGEADRPADALRLPCKLRSSRLRIDRDDGYAVLQRENEPVEPRRHERIRPRDQALHLGWCSQPDPVDVEARVDGDDSMASADERRSPDPSVPSGRPGTAQPCRRRRPERGARRSGTRDPVSPSASCRAPRGSGRFQLSRCSGNERLSPKTGVPSKWCKRSSSSPH